MSHGHIACLYCSYSCDPISPLPACISFPQHTAFLDDWVGDDPADLLHFYPIDWNIAIDLHQYEMFIFTNRYNWVDIDNTENSESIHIEHIEGPKYKV